MVRPTHRSKLARPDDGLAPAPEMRANLMGHMNRVYGGGTDDAEWRAQGQLRLHRRLIEHWRGIMTLPISMRTATSSGRKPLAKAALAVAATAVLLAGCKAGRRGKPRRRLEPGRSVAAPPDHGDAAADDDLAPGWARGTTACRRISAGKSSRSSSAIAVPDAGNSRLVIEAPSGSPNEIASMQAVAEIRALIAEVRIRSVECQRRSRAGRR